jgi:hypothetical protein
MAEFVKVNPDDDGVKNSFNRWQNLPGTAGNEILISKLATCFH